VGDLISMVDPLNSHSIKAEPHCKERQFPPAQFRALQVGGCGKTEERWLMAV
jgi:hypothetical protein